MKFNQITKISRGQDGAVWGSYLFRFQMDGSCHVYDLENLKPVAPGCYQPAIGMFDLDGSDRIVPHCNSVSFGTEFFEEGDEFPLLYCNIYNNYAKQADSRKGMCCVYRILREGDRFWSSLVQIIRLSFVEDPALWCSADRNDVRPYGNFIVDRDNGDLWVFNMIDDVKSVRYFRFPLPEAREGVMDPSLRVPVLTLTPSRIRDRFDCPYQNYIQGACCHKGVIYSLEGLANDPEAHAMALIGLNEKKQLFSRNFFAYGLTVEPELIDFMGDTCYYADNFGNLYTIDI